MKTVDFSETIATSDLKGRRSRLLIEFTKGCEGQGHFSTIYFLGVVYFVLYRAKLSGEHLQDHWSAGSTDLCYTVANILTKSYQYSITFNMLLHALFSIIFTCSIKCKNRRITITNR